MAACSDLSNRPSPDVIDRLIDTVALASTCLTVAVATRPHSPERERGLTKLREAITVPRQIVDDILAKGQNVPSLPYKELRRCELTLPKLEAGAVLDEAAQEPST
jgi:hypothetical protein